ncbi:MAG: type IV pilus biogenesis protein PilP [Candidatus Enterousia sp.]
MQNKIKFKNIFLIVGILIPSFMTGAYAALPDIDVVEDIEITSDTDADLDKASADAVAAYQVEGSLFEQITTLEQEKVLMQLEKERAQLDLELDRLAAEKIKLHMEIDTLSGRAEQAQQELETEKARLEAEAASLARQKEELSRPVEPASSKPASTSARNQESDDSIADKYRLVNVVGAGNQLQATVEDLSTGQNKRLSVGKVLNGFTVKSISLDEGVVFVKDGITENLNISSNAR